MTRLTLVAAALILAVVCVPGPCPAAAPPDEAALIAVLGADKTVAEKAAACRDLKTVGTAHAAGALAPLLADKDLSHWARWALESMPCPEAGAALRDALAKTSGLVQAGIADSLGERRDREAVASLAPLAIGADAQVASSAAAALGKIGGKEAAQALRAAQAKAPAAAQPAIADAMLLCADQFLAAGDAKAAAAMYKETYDSKAPEHVRTAAFRGLALASGDRAAAVVAEGLAGNDRAARRAGLQLVRQIKGETATKEFAALVAKVPPETQVALIGALMQRGDAAAAPAVLAAVASPSAEVRVAALDALAVLGDASVAPRLAEAAAKAAGPEQDAARESLARLRDPKVCDVLLDCLPKAQPAAQAEIVRALGQRQETQAVPVLLKMARGADEATRVLAMRSLAMLADAGAAGDLVQVLLQAKTDAEREAAEQALVLACGRASAPEASVPRILAAMKGAAVPARASLLRAAGRVGGREALEALRAGLKDGEAAIREASLRTMAESAGLDAAPDLLTLAREGPAVAQKVIALRGYWRLVGVAGGRPVDDRWKMCEAAMAASERPEEKKLGLTELAKVPHPAALKLAETLSGDEAVRTEAQAACVQIAAALVGTEPALAKAALRKVAEGAKDEGLRAQAAKALDAIDQYVGYVTAWQVAGPYREAGKECAALFDTVFAPERGAADVTWKPAPAPADASLAWQVDLATVVAGDQAVAYLRTRVYSPKEQKVRLDIGTDDGIKLWVNGNLVHSNNVQRPLKAGDDKAHAVLKEGWNDFLAKITQNNMGCGACIRIRTPEGDPIAGLRFDAAGAK